uniref:Semaphorin-4E-like n=1 Tax=Sinocyclocheilus grahami TaxID=75366 RepID=A0A672KGY7_SINGR
RMYVCGTKAFIPTCDYMSYADGNLTLEGKQEDGKGKCPFDPSQRYTSEMVDGVLYSATSLNFRGSEPVMMRSSEESIRTEFSSTWLNEPNFIHMAHIREGESNPEGDEDKLYLFFSETAVEYDSYTKMDVSRVARVCKGDLGGQRTLQRKWTSFLKARLDCPVPNNNLPLLVQDVFHLCPSDWTTCVFYAVFTPQLDSSQYSAVCAYKIEDIKTVFSKGKFKAPVPVETSFVKWVMYSADVPDPRPGACVDNHAREMGFTKSLELPDKTLQFIKDKPLMDQAVKVLVLYPRFFKLYVLVETLKITSGTCVTEDSKSVSVSFFHGNTVTLWCQPYSNLAQVQWQLNGRPINASNTFQILSDSLMIFNASADASGRYTCSSVERNYQTQHVAYDLKMWSASGTTALLHNVKEKENTLVAMVVLLSLILAMLVIWNLYKGHFPLPFCHRRVKDTENRCEQSPYENQLPEHKIASSTVNLNSNNNHVNDQRYSSSRETDRLSTTVGSSGQITMKYIDESEI